MTDETPILEPQVAYRLWAASYPPYACNPLMLTEERAMLALLPIDLCGSNILDAGCGSGRYILHARQRGATAVVGIDLTFEMLRNACDALYGHTVSGQTVSEPTLPHELNSEPNVGLAQASLEAIPMRDDWADIALCGLTLGHLPFLTAPLAELRRVLRPGGILLCSDFHPIGDTLGWKRNFKARGQRYIVRHTAHTLDTWGVACRKVGLRVENVIEAFIDPADISPGAQFEASGLEAPAVLVLALRRTE